MRCPRCRSRVRGGGYTIVGRTYCCRNCAQKSLCLCRDKKIAKAE